VLSHAGYEVGQASSGAKGLAMARDEPPDVIVADILMPEMNGVEEVRRRAEACGVSHILIKRCGPPGDSPRG
jgi:CheY-like chemotaxis protein